MSAVADPNTGVAVYDSYSQGGWLEVGGTSASSPIIASVFALAGTPASGTYPSSYIYQHTSDLYDVTSGSDYSGGCSPAYLCTAGTGYDGPTGWGTPDGTAAFTSGTGSNTVTVTNPGNQTSAAGKAVSLQIHATDSQSGQTLTFSAAGLPAGLSINSSSGLISGTPATGGTSNVTVTATDTTGASGSASFTWRITATPVTGLKATAKYTNLTATWNSSRGATGYKVTVTTHQGSVKVASATVSGTYYHLGHLQEKHGYAVHVLALPAAPGQKPAVAYVTTR